MMLADSGIAELIPIAIGVLYVLGQIAGVFGKREKPSESRGKPTPSSTAHAAPRPPRGAKPPTPPRISTSRPPARAASAPPSPFARPSASAPFRASPAPRTGMQQQRHPAPTMPAMPAARQHPVADIVQRLSQPASRPGPKHQPAPPKLGALGSHDTTARPAAREEPSENIEHQKKSRRRLTETERLLRVLRSQSGTRAAIQLSEVLAPPLALRDDHLKLLG